MWAIFHFSGAYVVIERDQDGSVYKIINILWGFCINVKIWNADFKSMLFKVLLYYKLVDLPVYTRIWISPPRIITVRSSESSIWDDGWPDTNIIIELPPRPRHQPPISAPDISHIASNHLLSDITQAIFSLQHNKPIQDNGGGISKSGLNFYC